MDLRTEFVRLYTAGNLSFTELCRRFSISRKTGYKWLARFQAQGSAGLQDLSRAPQHSPFKTTASIEQIILACKDQYPYWGGRKLRRVLSNQGYEALPTPSTITEILKRNGKLEVSSQAKPPLRFEHAYPNDLWQMDFKGDFRVGQQKCYPLTVLDDCSRFSLCLHACADVRGHTVQRSLTQAFQRYGLPRRMTMDNGPPWGAGGTSRFTHFTVWLIEHGITVGHSRPYHPQTQGKDERFHRTLDVELLGRREFESLLRCQLEFDRWRIQYNEIRPHEALGMQTPESRYEPSQRAFKDPLPEYEYGETDTVRKVARDQSASFKGYKVLVGQPFIGRKVAFRPTLVDGKYTVHFCHQQIGEVVLGNKSEWVKIGPKV